MQPSNFTCCCNHCSLADCVLYHVGGLTEKKIFLLHATKDVPCTGLGLKATAAQFVGVMGLTWAGSQLTKVHAGMMTS